MLYTHLLGACLNRDADTSKADTVDQLTLAGATK